MFRPKLRSTLLLLILVAGSASIASAQSVSAFFGVGTATDASNNGTIDFFNGGAGPFLGSPKLTGAFGTFGGEFMLGSRLGVGAEYSFRFSQGDYAGLGYRPVFYDFNAIYQPLGRISRVEPELQGGIGGETTHFYETSQFCAATCQNITQPVQNSSHFQIHGAAGVKLYVKPHIFIRPQIDLRYVPGLGGKGSQGATFLSGGQFSSSFVPEYTVAIGYTFGER